MSAHHSRPVPFPVLLGMICEDVSLPIVLMALRRVRKTGMSLCGERPWVLVHLSDERADERQRLALRPFRIR